MNQCIHGIDLLRWMMGDEIEEVYESYKTTISWLSWSRRCWMAVVKFKNEKLEQ